MAGKPKYKLDYAFWATNIFDGDTKIDRLLEAQGWVGFGIYFYLCQMAYKIDGYFYRWGFADAPTTARRMGGGVKAETVKQTVSLCLQIGLFDKRLFDRDRILTSRGIQKKYVYALKTRRAKTAVADYWLLDEEESEGFTFRTLRNNLLDENAHLLEADAHLLEANPHLPPANDHRREEKRREEKRKEDDGASAASVGVVVAVYQEKMGASFPPSAKPKLRHFVEKMGVECCLRAIEIASGVGKDWKYICGILNNKLRQGVTSLADWDAVEQERAKSRGSALSVCSTTASQASGQSSEALTAFAKIRDKAVLVRCGIELERLGGDFTPLECAVVEKMGGLEQALTLFQEDTFQFGDFEQIFQSVKDEKERESE